MEYIMEAEFFLKSTLYTLVDSKDHRVIKITDMTLDVVFSRFG